MKVNKMINFKFLSIIESWLLKFLTSRMGLAYHSSKLEMTVRNVTNNPIERE